MTEHSFSYRSSLNTSAGGPAAAGMVVTVGADMTLQILDPAMSFESRFSLQLSDFPYSLAVAGGLALCGCGDGALHVVDIARGKTLYALGANKHAVRTIDACHDKIVCSGDDGNVIIYSFGDVLMH